MEDGKARQKAEKELFIRNLQIDLDHQILVANLELDKAEASVVERRARLEYMKRRKSTYYMIRLLSTFVKMGKISMQDTAKFIRRIECKTKRDP